MDAKIRNPTENAIYKFTKNGAKKECILKNASAFLKFAAAKNIFAAAYSVPPLFLSEEENWGEKNIKHEKHPSKNQKCLTN